MLGHIDGKVAVSHCSFYDTNPIGPTHRKILAYNEPQGYDPHGTHTACTGVGDAGANDDTRGVAYLGKLVHNGIPSMTESQMYAAFNLHRQQGATVHTNSWGNDGTTMYDGRLPRDRQLLLAVRRPAHLLRGDEHQQPEEPREREGLPGGGRDAECSESGQFLLRRAPARRWTVAASPRFSRSDATSCRPSGSSGCGTASMSGTSMACPAISGTALLVREYFTAGYYHERRGDARRRVRAHGGLAESRVAEFGRADERRPELSLVPGRLGARAGAQYAVFPERRRTNWSFMTCTTTRPEL